MRMKLIIGMLALLWKTSYAWSDDGVSTVSEGYSSTYSESSDWSYTPDSYDDSDYTSGGYGSYYEHQSTYYDNYNDYDQYTRSYYNGNHNSGNHHHNHQSSKEQDKFVGCLVLLGCLACGACKCIEEASRKREDRAAHQSVLKRSQEKEEAKQKKITDVLSTVKELGSTTIEPQEEYPQPIYFNGPLSIQKPAFDTEFMVGSAAHPVLFRKVEVYCYRQTTSQRIERRGNQQRTVTDYNYISVWVNSKDFIDSSNFRDPKFRLNKRPQYQCETFIADSDLQVGPYFNVPIHNLQLDQDNFRSLLAPPLPEKRFFKQNDSNGVWEYEETLGGFSYIRCRKVRGLDTIGDIRISYETLNDFTNNYEVSILGHVKQDNKIEPLRSLKTCISSKTYGPRDFIAKQLRPYY